MYITWYTNIRPHIERKRFYFEVFNESMIMLCTYHMMLFTNFTTDIDAIFRFGYSFLGVFALLFFVNIGNVVYLTVHSLYINRKKNGKRDAAIKRMKNKKAFEDKITLKLNALYEA